MSCDGGKIKRHRQEAKWWKLNLWDQNVNVVDQRIAQRKNDIKKDLNTWGKIKKEKKCFIGAKFW